MSRQMARLNESTDKDSQIFDESSRSPVLRGRGAQAFEGSAQFSIRLLLLSREGQKVIFGGKHRDSQPWFHGVICKGNHRKWGVFLRSPIEPSTAMLSHWHIRSVLALLLSLSFAALAEDRSNRSALPTYRSTVSEVQVTFFATDQNNHSVLTITQSDLAAIDNERVIRNFRSFTRTDETALDVVVAVDLSESVLSRLAETKSELLQLLAQERAVPNEKISVLSFGGSFGAAPGRVLQESSGETEPAFLCSLDCGTAHSLNKLSAINSGSATPLFDALISAASFISSHRRAGARPILILISDGNDTISLHSAPDALAATLEAGALVYSIDIGSSEQHTLHRSGSAFLRQISELTGGRYFTGSDGRSQTTIFRVLNAALDDMRASYVLTYDLPKSESEFHSQRLLPSHNLNLTFHSRSSYNTVDQSPTRDSKNAD